ncbi:pyridoxal-dependent decarboxylase [Enterobacter bugandensis]|uniref:pyridoxal-dependent decarboxylase n=1 Tax=Enterobacter bugandensis TaxID=881260 RepID=UPI0020760176|nr:pyridoxal-dependent decarboxylase [Enterobacter bugandensis]MCM7239185.1 pyridoxal-dependent decarboxylase [Enterobacter bugandensis]MCM7319116.1 pyridoxal-dependent decarboxylase [Enterobacter bugandensis]MCM7354557.1 pyridoxal-dependent decarboxylase [Enterobacter bugandensis]
MKCNNSVFKIKEIHAKAQKEKNMSLGYPINQKFDYSIMSQLLSVNFNNIGDPFSNASTLLHTHELEQEVLDHFRKTWNANPRTPLTSESFWGYILSMGATEGNMYALWSARQYLYEIRQSELNSRSINVDPVVFYSEESHYSIKKCMNILGLKSFQEIGESSYPYMCPITEDGSWPHAVPINKDGAIEVECLSKLVDFFSRHSHQSIFVFNLGSTFRGAFDNVPVIWEKLSQTLRLNGFSIGANENSKQNFWIHIDGALGASYLSFLEIAYRYNISKVRGPVFDFRLPYVNSIVMSFHKWFGAPFASGIYMSKEKYRICQDNVQYINSVDSTLGGTRNGLSAILMWYEINSRPSIVQAKIAADCEQLAEYAFSKMEKIKLTHPSFYVCRAPQSLVVFFSRPNIKIFQQFHLSAKNNLAHIVVMPHVTRPIIDLLIERLHEEDAFTEEGNCHEM